MKVTLSSKKFLPFFLLCLMVITTNVFAQVGIGTVSPDVSAVLDISSTSQGMLTPRMTTAQKTAIVTPANGLIVYDTDLKAFFHYDSATVSWVKLSSDSTGRLKFKRIKSTDVLATVLAAEKTAGGNTKYLLDATTLYEINGTIMVDLPIELNNAYIAGLDSGEDKLIKATGDLFTGTTGGSIRVLTLVASGGNVFNIIGPGAVGAQTQSLILRDCIVANSSNVGKIENFSLLFMSIVQFSGNTNGIIYKDIRRLLISNVAWFGNNLGTFETLQGTFDLVQKSGGFNGVTDAAIGFDVSANPTIVADAVMDGVVFAGTLTTGKYVNGYTTGSYPGFSFDNQWSVDCTGIPVESDVTASGNLYLDRTTTSPTATFPTANTAYKVPGTTVSTNLYRMSAPVNNRIVYSGKKTRTISVTTSISFEASGTGVTDYLFFFVKFTALGVASIITSSETYIDSNSGFMQSFPVTGTIQVNSGDYIELHAARLAGTVKTITFRSYNMSIK